MPVLQLVPRKAVIHLHGGGETADIKFLDEDTSGEVPFAPRFTETLEFTAAQKGLMNRVRLTSGEDFRELECAVTVKRSAVENTAQAVGMLVYVPEYASRDGLFDSAASCLVNCELPARQFDELVAAARHGRLPDLVAVEVVGKGVKYGWEPDGSGFEWDNKNHRYIAIAKISFALPLVFQIDSDELDQDTATNAGIAPPSHAQLEKLIEVVGGLRKDIKGLLILAIVGAGAIFVGSSW